MDQGEYGLVYPQKKCKLVPIYGWDVLKVDYFDRENVFIKFYTAATEKVRDTK